MSITGSTKSREARQESFCPFDVTSAYRICKVGKLNSKEAAHFAQVLNRPTCGSRTELTVKGVDIRAQLNQKLSNGAVPTKGCVVKRCRSKFVSHIDHLGTIVKDGLDVFQSTSLRRINEPFELRHRGISPRNSNDLKA